MLFTGEKDGSDSEYGKSIKRFSLDDPNLISYQFINMDRTPGTEITFGDCPQEPCYKLRLNGIDSCQYEDFLCADFSIGGRFDGRVYPIHYLGTEIPIRKGCGFALLTKTNEVVFEIVDDRIGRIKAYMGLFPYSSKHKGIGFRETGCFDEYPEDIKEEISNARR